MKNDRPHFSAFYRSVGSALFALGLASAAATAQAQTTKDGPPTPAERGAETPNPANSAPSAVEGVTVAAPARPPLAQYGSDENKARFDAEAAKHAAFRAYRQSTPPLTTDDIKGVGDPNDLSKDYPGLEAYLPN
jgi:hypothetical protein